MDELEARVAALELLLVELMPWIDPQALADARRSIESGIAGAASEEADIRRQAASMIEDQGISGGRLRLLLDHASAWMARQRLAPR